MSYEEFRQELLHRIAAALALPYEVVAHHCTRTCYDDPRMAKARHLITRASIQIARRERGWRRKLKRARRLQRAACGIQTSNAWFALTLEHAVHQAKIGHIIQKGNTIA